MTGAVPPVFPEDQAHVVTEWATRLDVNAAAGLVDQIRDWLGKPEKVAEATRQWSPVTTGHLIGSGEGLVEAATNIADYWAGRGQVAFDRYATHLQGVIRDSRFPIEKVATTLTDSLGIIRDAYKAGTRFISDCAIAILKGLEGLPSILEGLVVRNPIPLLKGTVEAIVKALQGFVTAVTNLMTSTMDILTGKAQTGLKLESAPSMVPLPDSAPVSLGDRHRWKVRTNLG